MNEPGFMIVYDCWTPNCMNNWKNLLNLFQVFQRTQGNLAPHLVLCNIPAVKLSALIRFCESQAPPLEKVARLDPDAHCLLSFGTENAFSWPRLHVRGPNMDSYILPFSHLGDKFKHWSLVSFPWREKGKYSIPTCLQGNFPPNPKI